MYAVIKTGGKQYRVAADEILEVEKLDAAPGALVKFAEVMMIGGDAGVTVGAPFIAGASVTAELLEQGRGPKTINFKKRRRKNSRRKKGHRQDLSRVRILEVLGSGVAASKKPTGEGVLALRYRGQGKAFAILQSPVAGRADDLSLIDGVGPKYQESLHKIGIFHLWQIAGMTKQNIAVIEEAGQFGGHITSGEWVAQAKELLDGKPPRAKSDRARA